MKRNLKAISILIASLFAALAFIGCRDFFAGSDITYSTGHVLDIEDIQSIIADQAADTTLKYPTDTAPDGSLIVYWLKGGSVWHKSLSCSSISESENILSGSISEALEAGKERPCKNCSSDITFVAETSEGYAASETYTMTDVSTSELYIKEYDNNGEVIAYWLDGGSVWHESKNCPVIRSAESSKIISGEISDAYYSGKERPCKICSFDSVFDIYDAATTELIISTEITESRFPKEYSSSGELTVFWLAGGEVWHERRNCSTVMKAEQADVFSGNVYDAYYAGKSRACMRCSSDSDIIIDIDVITTAEHTSESQTTAAETVNNSDIVYWVENGSVWHLRKNCVSLSKTDEDDIFEGSMDEAVICGKERACKRCG